MKRFLLSLTIAVLVCIPFARAAEPTNQAPVINDPADAVVFAGSPVTLTVSLSDEDVEAATLKAVSSNQTLLPNSAVVMSGSGSQRTVVCTPAANQLGTSTVTLTVSDGKLSAAQEASITVVRALVNPAAVSLTDTTNKATLVFSYPAQFRPLILDSYWTHFGGGGPATEDQKAAIVRQQITMQIADIVAGYMKREAEKQASASAGALIQQVLPHVTLEADSP